MAGDEDPTYFLAKVIPGNAAPIYRELVSRILYGDYTGEPLGTLPDTLINGRPDLVDQAAVRAAMRAQLERTSEFRGSVWAELAKAIDGDEIAEDDADVDESVKEALLDSYFEQCYSERDA